MVSYDDEYSEIIGHLHEIEDDELISFFRRVMNDISYMHIHAPRAKGGTPSDSTWRFAVYGDEIRTRGLVEKLEPEYQNLLNREIHNENH